MILLADAVQGQIRNAYIGDTIPEASHPQIIEHTIELDIIDSRDDSCAAYAHGY